MMISTATTIFMFPKLGEKREDTQTIDSNRSNSFNRFLFSHFVSMEKATKNTSRWEVMFDL